MNDNEYYSRGSCIPIHGVECNENDDANFMNKVESCCGEIVAKFDLNKIYRVHYIGKPFFYNDSKQKVR